MDILKYLKNQRLNISVKANSNQNRVIGFDKEKKRMKLEIAAPAKNSKANVEIVRFLSKLLKKKIRIVSGFTSKNKSIKIEEFD